MGLDSEFRGESGIANSESGEQETTRHSPLTTRPSSATRQIRKLFIQQWEASHGKSIFSVLSGSQSLAGSNESGRTKLSDHENLSQGRTIWNDFSDPSGSSLSSGQHSRGTWQGEPEGVHSVSQDCSGITERSGDSPNPVIQGGTDNRTGYSASNAKSSDRGENAAFPDSHTSKQTNELNETTRYSPLATHENQEDIESLLNNPTLPIPPFIWNEDRRAQIRAELDAYYAKLYGLTRDELRYILDPADVYGPDFPSETFRVLKNNEIKKYGEYRTQRLVLEAWDALGF